MKFLAMDTTGANFDEETVNKHLKEDVTVLILEADILEDAKAKLATITFAKMGVTAFNTVIPIQPFTGFNALFEKN